MVEVRASRLAIEALADEGTVAGVTRTEQQVAGLFTGTVQAQASRLSLEVLASEIPMAAVTRTEQQVAGLFTGTTEVRGSRISIECLARQGSAGPVVPLALADDAHVFLHNWATRAEMTTSFRTSVNHSPESGAESRRGLSLKPFRTLKLEWMVGDDLHLEDLERLEVFLRRMTDQRFQVPIYMDQQELDQSYLAANSTIMVPTRRARFFPGARVAIVQVDLNNQPISFSFHIIESMTNDSLTFASPLGVDVAASSLVFPVMDCELMLDVEADYATSRVPSVKITVAEAPGASQLPPLKSDIPEGASEYDDRPIWFIEPDWAQGISKGRKRYGQRTNEGRADFVSPEGDRARQSHKYVLHGTREDMWDALEFFETRRGRLRSFWHIDQDQYLECVDLHVAGVFVGVEEIGTLADFAEEMEYIGIIMADGTYFVRQAVTIQQVLTVFRVTLDVPIDPGLDPANVVRIARARESRFDSDAFTETWNHTGHMTATVEIIETINEDDFPTV